MVRARPFGGRACLEKFMNEPTKSGRRDHTILWVVLAAAAIFLGVLPIMLYALLHHREETVVATLPAGTLVSVAYQSRLLREQTTVTATAGTFLVEHAFPGARGQALVLEGRKSGD